MSVFIKLYPNIVPFRPQNITSGTCIINFGDLHSTFWTYRIASRACPIASELILPLHNTSMVLIQLTNNNINTNMAYQDQEMY